MNTTHLDHHALNAMLNLYDANGQINFDADREAANRYFLDHVNQNTVFFHSHGEKIDYLVDNGYYEPEVFEQYSRDIVLWIYAGAYAHKFRFPTFLGAFKFYTGYALKTNDGQRYLERYEDRVVMTALTLARGDSALADKLVEAMITGRFQPATPTFLNAGKKQRGELVSCFLLRVEDNMESIGRAITSSLQLSKRGGGVALCLTNLRETGAPIKNIENQCSGVVPVMKMLEDAFSYANQLGARQGAGAVYLNVHHPDILRFLDTKRENADEKIRIKTLSLGVVIPDITMELARDNAEMCLFSPYDVEKVYGVPFTEISVTEKYHEMVADDRIKKTTISARDLFKTLAEIQFESGYPYIMYEDTVNRANPIKGRITMSNLCVHGDTKILTKEGEKVIYEVAGTQEEVWNGEEWSEVDVVQTGVDQELVRVVLDDGSELLCTPYHKFYVMIGGQAREMRACQLMGGDRLISWVMPDGTPVPERRVSSMRDIPGLHDTFCFNEPKRHMGVFNGILTGNCSEILQVSAPSTYHEDGSYEQIGQDISCNLGSLNIAATMDGGNLGQTVETAIRALTAVSEMSDLRSVPSVQRGNHESRAIGLGQMNLHGFLARERIPYDSPAAVDFTNVYFATILYHALRASNKLARERGNSFKGFADSTYATGRFFDKYVSREWTPHTTLATDLFIKFGVAVPTIYDWLDLRDDVMEYGLYNRNLQAIPPTGSISYINNSTSSIHPIAAKIEIRKEGKIGRVYYPAPFMTNENLDYYKDAYEIGPEAIIDIYAAASQHVDQGLSLTLFFPDTATTRDINKAQIYAWRKGIKTLYYIRIRQNALEGTEVEGCVSCSL